MPGYRVPRRWLRDNGATLVLPRLSDGPPLARGGIVALVAGGRARDRVRRVERKATDRRRRGRRLGAARAPVGARAITVVGRRRLGARSARTGPCARRHCARPTRVRVLLPGGYGSDPPRRYPVLYLLHGADFGLPLRGR